MPKEPFVITRFPTMSTNSVGGIVPTAIIGARIDTDENILVREFADKITTTSSAETDTISATDSGVVRVSLLSNKYTSVKDYTAEITYYVYTAGAPVIQNAKIEFTYDGATQDLLTTLKTALDADLVAVTLLTNYSNPQIDKKGSEFTTEDCVDIVCTGNLIGFKIYEGHGVVTSSVANSAPNTTSSFIGDVVIDGEQLTSDSGNSFIGVTAGGKIVKNGIGNVLGNIADPEYVEMEESGNYVVMSTTNKQPAKVVTLSEQKNSITTTPGNLICEDDIIEATYGGLTSAKKILPLNDKHVVTLLRNSTKLSIIDTTDGSIIDTASFATLPIVDFGWDFVVDATTQLIEYTYLYVLCRANSVNQYSLHRFDIGACFENGNTYNPAKILTSEIYNEGNISSGFVSLVFGSVMPAGGRLEAVAVTDTKIFMSAIVTGVDGKPKPLSGGKDVPSVISGESFYLYGDEDLLFSIPKLAEHYTASTVHQMFCSEEGGGSLDEIQKSMLPFNPLYCSSKRVERNHDGKNGYPVFHSFVDDSGNDLMQDVVEAIDALYRNFAWNDVSDYPEKCINIPGQCGLYPTGTTNDNRISTWEEFGITVSGVLHILDYTKNTVGIVCGKNKSAVAPYDRPYSTAYSQYGWYDHTAGGSFPQFFTYSSGGSHIRLFLAYDMGVYESSTVATRHHEGAGGSVNIADLFYLTWNGIQPYGDNPGEEYSGLEIVVGAVSPLPALHIDSVVSLKKHFDRTHYYATTGCFRGIVSITIDNEDSENVHSIQNLNGASYPISTFSSGSNTNSFSLGLFTDDTNKSIGFVRNKYGSTQPGSSITFGDFVTFDSYVNSISKKDDDKYDGKIHGIEYFIGAVEFPYPLIKGVAYRVKTKAGLSSIPSVGTYFIQGVPDSYTLIAGDAVEYVEPRLHRIIDNYGAYNYVTTLSELYLADTDVVISGTAADDYPVAIEILTLSTTVTGTGAKNFEEGSYRYKYSFLYDGYQDAPLSLDYKDIAVSSDGSQYNTVTITISGSMAARMSRRITDICIWCAALDDTGNTEQELYRFAKQISMSDRNFSYNSADDVWTHIFQDENIRLASFDTTTGYSETLTSVSILRGCQCECMGYLFAGNVSISTKDSVKIVGNAIVRSLPGRYSIFNYPYDFAILKFTPIVMKAYGGRLYVFGSDKYSIVNPDSMSIEYTSEMVGCANKHNIVSTEYGIFVYYNKNMYYVNGSECNAIGDAIAIDPNSTGYSLSLITDDTQVFMHFIQSRQAIAITGYTTNKHIMLLYSITRKRWIAYDISPNTNGDAYNQSEYKIVGLYRDSLGRDKLVVKRRLGYLEWSIFGDSTSYRNISLQYDNLDFGDSDGANYIYEVNVMGVSGTPLSCAKYLNGSTIQYTNTRTAKLNKIKLYLTSITASVTSIRMLIRKLLPYG